MAQEITIPNTKATATIRSPLWVAIWSVLTLGIYAIVWIYRLSRELRDYGRSKGYDLGQRPVNTLLAVTLGAFVIVPAVLAFVRLTQRVQGAERISGGPQATNGWLALALYLIITPAYVAYLQSAMNRVWAAETGVALPGGGDHLPPPLPFDTAGSFAPPTAGDPGPSEHRGFAPPAPGGTPPPGPPPA